MVIAAVVLIAFAASVSAHTLATDRGISAELHIPQDDTAQAGKPIDLQFTFADMPPTFSIVECACRLQISGSDDFSATASAQLDGSRTDRLASSILFPKSGVYRVTLTGYATSAQKVPFNLKYAVRVDRAPVGVSRTAKIVSGIVIGLSLLIVAGVLAWHFRPRKHAGSRIHPEG